MNKFLYKKAYWLYFELWFIRMNYYLITNQKEKARKTVTEHFDWNNDDNKQ